jgi:hypothetical protein
MPEIVHTHSSLARRHFSAPRHLVPVCDFSDPCRYVIAMGKERTPNPGVETRTMVSETDSGVCEPVEDVCVVELSRLCVSPLACPLPINTEDPRWASLRDARSFVYLRA